MNQIILYYDENMLLDTLRSLSDINSKLFFKANGKTLLKHAIDNKYIGVTSYILHGKHWNEDYIKFTDSICEYIYINGNSNLMRMFIDKNIINGDNKVLLKAFDDRDVDFINYIRTKTKMDFKFNDNCILKLLHKKNDIEMMELLMSCDSFTLKDYMEIDNDLCSLISKVNENIDMNKFILGKFVK